MNKTFIIAELSANHNGSKQIALDSIRAAKQAGADAIKIQTYTADTLTLNCNKPDFKVGKGLWEGETFYSLYQKAYTPHPNTNPSFSPLVLLWKKTFSLLWTLSVVKDVLISRF